MILSAPISTPAAASTATRRVVDAAAGRLHAQRRRSLDRRLRPAFAKARPGRPPPWRPAAPMPSGSATLRASRGVDVRQVVDHALADRRRLHPRQLVLEGADDVLLLGRALAVPEQRGLAEVVVEAGAAPADLGRLQRLRDGSGSPAAPPSTRNSEPVRQRVRLVADAAPARWSMRCVPSRWKLWNGQTPRLIGSSWKLGPPRRDSCVSVYENSRPCSSGSLLKSMPGTTWPGWKATCSVSAKKLSGLRLSTSRPTTCTGTSSSGISLVGSSRSKPSCCALALLDQLHAQLPLGEVAARRSRPTGRGGWKSGSLPAIFCASSQASACLPSLGFQWNLTKCADAVRVDEAEGVDAEAFHHPHSCAAARGPTSATSACACSRASARRNPRTCRARWRPAACRGAARA